MTEFDRTKFIATLTSGAAFSLAQANTLADALVASLAGAPVPGESHEEPPLRGAATDLA